MGIKTQHPVKKTECDDYCRSSKHPVESEPEITCFTCSFGQKSLSECTLADGTWKDDYK